MKKSKITSSKRLINFNIPSEKIFKSTLPTLISSVMLAYSGSVLVHGGIVNMISIEEAMSTAGAEVDYDDYFGIYTITKNSIRVQIKANATTVKVNGKPLKITNPLIIKNGRALIPNTLVNEILQSGLDNTFKLESTPHPLNSLNSDEIAQTLAIIKNVLLKP